MSTASRSEARAAAHLAEMSQSLAQLYLQPAEALQAHVLHETANTLQIIGAVDAANSVRRRALPQPGMRPRTGGQRRRHFQRLGQMRECPALTCGRQGGHAVARNHDLEVAHPRIGRGVGDALVRGHAHEHQPPGP